MKYNIKYTLGGIPTGDGLNDIIGKDEFSLTVECESFDASDFWNLKDYLEEKDIIITYVIRDGESLTFDMIKTGDITLSFIFDIVNDMFESNLDFNGVDLDKLEINEETTSIKVILE